MFLLILVLLFVASAPIATALLAGVAGFIAPFIVGLLRKATNLTGRWAMVLTVTVCTVLAALVALVAYFTGELTTWTDLVSLIPWIFTEATILYHLGLPVPTAPVTKMV